MTLRTLRRLTVCLALAVFTLCPVQPAQAQFTLYGAQDTFNGSFSTVNAANGTLTPVTTADQAFYAGLDAQPGTSTLYGAGGSFLYTVDPTSGLPMSTTFFTGAGSGDVFSLSFAPDGVLYGLGNGNGNLYTIDPATGATSLVGTSGEGIFGLEFGPNGTLYGCGIDLFVINPTDGSATDMGPLTASGPITLFNDLDFAPNGAMYGVTNSLTTDSLYSINLTTDAASLIGPTGGDLGAIASIPEPHVWAVLTLGVLAGLVFARRGRRSVTGR